MIHKFDHLRRHTTPTYMEEANQWVISITEKLKLLPNTSEESAFWGRRSICRIPASVTDVNPRAYKPHMVSIGPYHHGSDNFVAMEEHKERALLHFLKRSNKPLHAYVDALAPVARDLMDAYDQLSPEWHGDPDKFLQLMIIDGCFILEIVRTATTIGSPSAIHPRDQSQTQPDHQSLVVKDYAANDPIFSNHGKLYIVPYLKRDMLMLENQLPMLVLQKLVAVQNDKSLKDSRDLTKRILKFFQQSIPAKYLLNFNDSLHILDIYRKGLLLVEEPRPRRKTPKFMDIHQGKDDIIRSATEMNEAGIYIKRSKTRSLKDISFHGGVLKLPLIVVDDATESLFLNLIAFERLHPGAGNSVSSYVFFMDNIISSERDVRMLHSRGVLQNALGSDKAVAKMFHSLTKDITLDPESGFDHVHGDVTAYCQKPWRRWRAELVHNYFTDPWLISAAAILLFVLTILQTIFTVLAYFNPPP